MPRYGTEERLPGLAEAGESIGGAIAEWGGVIRKRRDEEDDSKLFDALLQPDNSGRPAGETLSEAPNKPLAMLKFMKDVGVKPTPERFAQMMTLITVPAGEGPSVKVMPGDEYASQMGIPEPGRFKGYVVKHNTKSGGADWLYQPKEQQPEEPAEAPVMRSVDQGGESITYQWDAGSKQWKEFARAQRWQPDKPGEGPDQFDTLSAAEKAAIEQAAGMQPGSLADVAVQRNRVTGRLHNLPGQLDALSRLLMGGAGPAPAGALDEDEEKPAKRSTVPKVAASPKGSGLADRFKGAR